MLALATLCALLSASPDPVVLQLGGVDTLSCTPAPPMVLDVVPTGKLEKVPFRFTAVPVGEAGGTVRALADVSLVVPSREPARVREVHGVLADVLCSTVEQRLTDAGWFAAATRRTTSAPIPIPIVAPLRATSADQPDSLEEARSA